MTSAMNDGRTAVQEVGQRQHLQDQADQQREA